MNNMETNNPKSTSTRKPRAKKIATVVSPVQEKMNKLETAYMSALSGQIKFGEVKSIFKKLHKEIKSSVKKEKN